MPPKAKDLASIPEDEVLSLQDWLKLLSSRGVSMRLGMSLAAKAYTGHNTKAKLKSLPISIINETFASREDRKAVQNALKQIGSGQANVKKRQRDDDLLRPLPKGDEIRAPESLSFDEITDPEELLPITVTVNRAPVKCAWTYVIARRLGFDAQEALSIAQVHVHISSLKHALFLGNVLNPQQAKEAEDEIRELPGEHDYKAKATTKDWKKGKPQPAVGSSQPWVSIMNSKMYASFCFVDLTPDPLSRDPMALGGQFSRERLSSLPSALKTFVPHVLGAMQLVAQSYEPQELDRVGLHLYGQFKPDVTGWGQRGTLSVARILETMKDKVADSGTAADGEAETRASASAPDSDEVKEENEHSERPSKKPRTGEVADHDGGAGAQVSEDGGSKAPEEDGSDPKTPSSDFNEAKPGMTVEEYEAMLDAEAADWDFPDGI